MLFDWQATLASELLPRALRLLSTRQWPFPDQDVLNIVAQDRWMQLDLRWNVTTRFDEMGLQEPWVRHFTMRGKPWMRDCRFADRPYKKVYLDAFAGTDWQAFVDPDSQDWSISIPLRQIQRKLNLRRRWRLARYMRHHCHRSASGAP